MSRALPILLLIACTADSDPLADCAIGVSPETIDEVVEQVRSLPEPSVACFVASLERPLLVATAFSTTSTQPSTDIDPRTFLFLGEDLVVTTVARGPAADQLEISERFDGARSVKAELHAPLGEDDPFEAVLDEQGEGTRCGVCHRDEAVHPEQPGRFVSRALRPQREQVVSVGDSALDHLSCEDDSARCERLRALFGFGAVEEVEFGVGFDVMF